MIKNTILFTFLILGSFIYAQIPAGYYDNATGTGFTLKTQLHNIIDGHIDQGYGGLYTTYTTSDIDSYYENNGTLLDMYSENPTGADSYEYTYGTNQDNGTGGTSEGQKYNREHVVPQSFFDSDYPARSDAHFVVPSDKYVNAQKGNLGIGKVGSANYTSSNGTKRGNNLNSGYSAGYSGVVFEPIDEFKGDIARMIFYFATRYEDQMVNFYNTSSTATQARVMFDGTADQVFSPTFLNILKTWHQMDPVSQRETDRNNAIYDRQSNRNPFIDHPEWVSVIWGDPLSVEDFEYQANKSISVFPTQLKEFQTLNIQSKEDQILIDRYQIFNTNGILVKESKLETPSQKITLRLEKAGIYIIKITGLGFEVNKKIIVKP